MESLARNPEDTCHGEAPHTGRVIIANCYSLWRDSSVLGQTGVSERSLGSAITEVVDKLLKNLSMRKLTFDSMASPN